MRPAVFLDRDGVLVETALSSDGVPQPPFRADEAELVGDAADATARLRDAGFALVVVTNQPDVARGITTRERVEGINELVRDRLQLDAVYACFHDGDGCACRKPKAGMLRAASLEMDLDLAASWLVGDRWVDIAAAAASGVRSVLLERPYSWRRAGGAEPPPGLAPDATTATFAEAAALIAGTVSRSRG
ncbi:MAG TPA: HAD-IIIA family hydrolase [Acidimicrobiia bacterium]|nr:HAD-IIIA family hydrolase [Acidimicrobiia bacterium]